MRNKWNWIKSKNKLILIKGNKLIPRIKRVKEDFMIKMLVGWASKKGKDLDLMISFKIEGM